MSESCQALGDGLEWGGAIAILVGCVLLIVHGRPGWDARVALRQTAIVASGLVVYFGVRHLTEGEEARAIAHAWTLIDLERSLGLAHEEAIQEALAGSGCGAAVLNWVYIWWHWPVILLSAIWLLLQRRPVYYRYRNAMLLSGALGLIVFATYPVAPPRLVPDLGLEDTVTRFSHSYRVLQPTAFTAQYAAMPSLHFGWNLLMGVALARSARHISIRAFGIIMPVAMMVAVVATANHFIVDVVAGAAFALFGLAVATHGAAMAAWFRGRRPARG